MIKWLHLIMILQCFSVYKNGKEKKWWVGNINPNVDKSTLM